MSKSNSNVENRSEAYLTAVLRAEPDFYANKRDVLLYEFSNGRQFRGDPTKVATAYPDD